MGGSDILRLRSNRTEEDDHMFEDRTDAGNKLATALRERDIDVDIVMAIPRGGLPLGRAIADEFDVPLDIVVASKMGAPHNPEYAIGAAASDGSVWLNDDAIGRLDLDEAYIESTRHQEAENARQKVERYRKDREAPDLTNKTVVIVDDGVATGSTAFACIRQVREANAERIVLAVPVGPPDSIDDLSAEVDDVVCLETPRTFQAVGQFYGSFDQVTDEEAMAYLAW